MIDFTYLSAVSASSRPAEILLSTRDESLDRAPILPADVGVYTWLYDERGVPAGLGFRGTARSADPLASLPADKSSLDSTPWNQLHKVSHQASLLFPRFVPARSSRTPGLRPKA